VEGLAGSGWQAGRVVGAVQRSEVAVVEEVVVEEEVAGEGREMGVHAEEEGVESSEVAHVRVEAEAVMERSEQKHC
jgi:hypothetical protein